MNFGLSNEDWERLKTKLITPLKQQGAQVWIFGSRARGNHRPFSDIDVLFELPSGKKLPSGLLSEIKELMEESRLSYKVDLVNIQDLANSYRNNALAERIEV